MKPRHTIRACEEQEKELRRTIAELRAHITQRNEEILQLRAALKTIRDITIQTRMTI